ncbi:MarR family winged helix-turn-helix transcriptional regulator [Amycolatopsis sp. Hca4]|uniref:MarR family winged helix-turn-helix transcriptional regulator n=1 Tax=Amycolatopsis sp. Hca4 TaxID=2742131 RepID=UPI0015927253|nr:MarR family transcriptional regulator [Amycolatopsis sp. Hca4]QKV80734.1 MarR family transcriptional regulator [Amycolatopsis sp. Hca4]
MATRADRNATDPDLGVLSGRLLFAVQRELFTRLATLGFGDLKHRHGAVLAYLDEEGTRATDLSRLSGQYKQIIGTLVDELEALGYVERRPDPSDRRAKLIYPTERGLVRMRAADEIMADIQRRHARRLGRENYRHFKAMLTDITDHQRAHLRTLGEDEGSA